MLILIQLLSLFSDIPKLTPLVLIKIIDIYIYIYVCIVKSWKQSNVLNDDEEDGHIGLSSLRMYYALNFVLVEHSECHEPIFVLINVFMLLA